MPSLLPWAPEVLVEQVMLVAAQAMINSRRLSDRLEFHSNDQRLEVDYRVSPGFQPQRHKGNPNNGLFIPLNNTVYMVLGYNAYN